MTGELMKERDIIVVKYGSTSVSNKQGMDQVRVESYTDSLVALRQRYTVVVVSSGSIATGMALRAAANQRTKVSDQTLAMLGAPQSVGAWQAAFARHDVLAGQLLVTHREIDDPDEGAMLKRALHDNLSAGVISVINENDALSDVELAKLSYGGDNDGLAAHIAKAVGAQSLLLLTGVRGLIDTNGQTVSMVNKDNLVAAQALAGESDGLGRGGMASKLAASILANESGITAHIAHAEADLLQVLDGVSGTTVLVGNNYG
jgi:glutamate 5-kinase